MKSSQLTIAQIDILLGNLALNRSFDKALSARVNRAAAAFKMKFTDPLSAIRNEISAAERQIEDWARANPHLFAEKKTINLINGDVSLKDGPPKVFLLKNWTDALCVKALEKLSKWKKLYIRPKPELNRSAILADYNAGKVKAETLKKFGVEIANSSFVSIDVKPAVPAK